MNHIALKLGNCLKITSHFAHQLNCFLKLNKPFVKFLLVGLFNTFVGLSTMFILNLVLDWPYWLSTFTGNTIGAAVSFVLNRAYTFNSKIAFSSGLPRFAAVIFVCYVLSYSASAFAARMLEDVIWDQRYISSGSMAMLIGTGLYTILNYFGQKWFVFKK